MDSTTVAIIGALGTAVAGAAGWFSKQGVDAWLKLRADRREDVRLHDQREDVLDAKEDSTLRYIIGIQEGELKSLRAEIKEMQAAHRTELNQLHSEHNECERRFAMIQTELKLRMESFDQRMGRTEKNVHEVRNAAHEIAMKVAVKEAEAAQDSKIGKKEV